MKKKRLLFIIFVFLLPSVFALEQEELYSGTVYPGENVTINNQTFIFNLGSRTDKISIITPSGGIIVKQGECEIKDFFNVCFDGTEFWYHNYTIDKEYYKAKVKVSEILAKIKLIRTIENKDLLIGEETKIDVMFNNTGDRDATDVVFKDDFPSEFIITDVTNCKIEGNSTRWYGTLLPFLPKSCSYKIKALNKTTFSSIASIQYNDGMRIETVNSGKVRIKVPDYQLNISTYLGDDKISVGEETGFTIILRNIHSDKIIRGVSFKISMPIGLKVTTLPKYMRIDYNKYSWNGMLTPDKSMKFFFEIKAERKKDYDIITNAVFIINNLRKEVKTLDKLKVNGIEEAKEIEEEPSTDINLSLETIEEENLSLEKKGEEVITEPDTDTIPVTVLKEDIKTLGEKSIIKKLFDNIFFIILDVIILSLIIIIVMKIIKAKRQNY